MKEDQYLNTQPGYQLKPCVECGAAGWALGNYLCDDCAFNDQRQPPDAHQVGGSHYTDMHVQPWAIIDTWPLPEATGFYRGNVLKYIMRLHDKDDALTNARKALHYAQKLVEKLEAAQ